MDLGSIGSGAGSGFVTAIFTWLISASGYKRRLEVTENALILKQDKTVCEAHHRALECQIGDIKRSQDSAFNKLDKIYDHLIEGSK